MTSRGSRCGLLPTAVRALPLAALTALVAAVLTIRGKPRAPPQPAGIAPPSSSISTGATGGAPGPLRGPEPPPSARVPEGAPRTLHGGARRTHRSAATGPLSAKVAWEVDLGGPVATQVVAAPDEKVLYAATLGGALVALSREGRVAWRVDLGGRSYASPAVTKEGTVYAGSDSKRLFAVTPGGKVLYRVELGDEVDTAPALAPSGEVIVAAGRQVTALRPGGDVVWRFQARRKVFTGVALSDDGVAIFGAQDDAVYGVSLKTGLLVFRTELGADVDGGPAIDDDGDVVVGTDAGEVVRLGRDGAVRSRTAVGGYVRGPLSIARNGDALAGVYGPAPRMVRVGRGGELIGAFGVQGTGAREFGVHGGALEDARGTLYFGTQDDRVYAVAASGALLFSYATRADVDAPLTLLSDGSLVVPSEDGHVSLLVP